MPWSGILFDDDVVIFDPNPVEKRELESRIESICSANNVPHVLHVDQVEVSKCLRHTLQEEDDGGVGMGRETESDDGTKRETEARDDGEELERRSEGTAEVEVEEVGEESDDGFDVI